MRNDTDTRDLDAYISECASYLLERKSGHPIYVDAREDGKMGRRSRSIDPYGVQAIPAVLDQVERLSRKLHAAEAISTDLAKRAAHGRISQFSSGGRELQELLRNARQGIIDARVACLFAHEVGRELKSVGKESYSARRQQLSSVRMAVGYFDNPKDRRARSVAIRIMEQADIEVPSNSTLSSFLRQIREELNRA